MKLIIPIVLVSAVLADIRQPARFTYNNNIIHQNPHFPADQAGQSSVQVSFNPNEVPQTYNTYSPVQPVQQQYRPQIQTYQQQPKSQLFNVGYSVKFTNNQQPKVPQIPKSLPPDGGEIITGTRKVNEQVQRPEEFISALENKKHKISGIRPKTTQNYPNPKVVLDQVNLAPATQQYLRYLEQTKQAAQNNAQELQQRYSWRNLSPGVEIIRSTEVPARFEVQQFDHAKALGRSQEFDHTNAVENQDLAQFYKQAQENLPPITRTLVQVPQQQQIVLPQQVDTSLLQEPLPIQVDTRLLQEAIKYYKQPQPQQTQQKYRTIPQNEYQTKQQSAQSQYLMFKPQPLTSIHPAIPEQAPRQARFIPDLQTNLRPPPYNPHHRYQRRLYMG